MASTAYDGRLSTTSDAGTAGFAGRTAWARSVAAPVRDFLGAETGSAAVVAAATIVALLWANSPWSHAYNTLWSMRLAIRVGSAGIATDLRHWVNEGLMTLFFLVVGLEAKREMDLGEFRDRRRIAVPVLAARYKRRCANVRFPSHFVAGMGETPILRVRPEKPLSLSG